MLITKKRVAELARELPKTLTSSGDIPDVYMNISNLKLKVRITDEKGKRYLTVSYGYVSGFNPEINVILTTPVTGFCTVELPFGLLYKKERDGYKRLSYAQIEPVLYQLIAVAADKVDKEIDKQIELKIKSIQARVVPVLTDELRQRVAQLRNDYQINQGYSDLFEGDVNFMEYFGRLYVSGKLKRKFNHLTKEDIFGFMVREDGVSRSFEVKQEDGHKYVRYEFEPF